jgi:small subunit ribosomal protein S17
MSGSSEVESKKKIVIGKVLKVSQSKTRVVGLSYTKTNNVFRKPVVRTRKYLVHDEHDISKEGDSIVMVQCRPISARKSWSVLKVI